MADIISSDLKQDDKNAWRTDPRVFKTLHDEFNFTLDAAASEKNALCKMYFTKEQDVLAQNWSSYLCEYHNPAVWLNPPYGRGLIKQFMDKCISEKYNGVTSVVLVPATLEAGWLDFDEISEIRIVTGGRLSFYHPITNKKIGGNTRGSMIVIFSPSDRSCNITRVSREDLLKGIDWEFT